MAHYDEQREREALRREAEEATRELLQSTPDPMDYVTEEEEDVDT